MFRTLQQVAGDLQDEHRIRWKSSRSWQRLQMAWQPRTGHGTPLCPTLPTVLNTRHHYFPFLQFQELNRSIVGHTIGSWIYSNLSSPPPPTFLSTLYRVFWPNTFGFLRDYPSHPITSDSRRHLSSESRFRGMKTLHDIPFERSARSPTPTLSFHANSWINKTQPSVE